MSTQPSPELNPSPGPDPRKFAYLPARQLQVDQRVQRECDPEKVAQLANEWDWLRVEALTVADNGDKTYTVVEGQHRALAAGELDARLQLPCLILPGRDLTDADQAQIAYDVATGRRGHTAYEKWRSRLVAGHPHEVAATAVLDELGVRVGKTPSANTIGAVATIRRIVHGGNFSPQFGAELLNRTIAALMIAFPTYDHESNVTRWNRELLLAVSQIIARNPDLDMRRLGEKMRVRPAIQWINLGQRDPMPASEVILNGVIAEYNRGLRKGRLA